MPKNKHKITKKETKKRLGYILLSFFTFYIVAPLRDFVDITIDINPIYVGLVGIILTLYFFEF